MQLNRRVDPSPNLRRSGPPHNPGLRDLVAAKRRWASPQKREDAMRGFRGWHERGYLPHRDEPGLTQFVTFRLADTFPEALRSEWEHLWQIEHEEQRHVELQAYLDKGRGECYLRQPAIARLVEDALRFFHPERYHLAAWVVMPNHVHVLFKVAEKPMSEIVGSWKKYTALKANHILQRHGSFWEPDYWDTFMRGADHESATRHYIETNPVGPGLVHDPTDWPWSSARLRDGFGDLKL